MGWLVGCLHGTTYSITIIISGELPMRGFGYQGDNLILCPSWLLVAGCVTSTSELPVHPEEVYVDLCRRATMVRGWKKIHRPPEKAPRWLDSIHWIQEYGMVST